MKRIVELFFLSLGITFGLQSFAQSPTAAILKGGMAKVNITPQPGCRLAGHFYESISTGVHDSLWARAMAFQQGHEKFVFVFCDLIGITPNVSTNARRIASAKTGIPFEHIVVAATHSHTGPLFYGFQHDYFHKKALANGVDPHEKTEYSGFLIGQVVKAIVQANKNFVAVKIEIGIAKNESLSHNRRYYMKNGEVVFNPGPLNPDIVRPAGPVDPDLGILIFRELNSKKIIGGLTSFAMHADTYGSTLISADYPYYLEEKLKSKFGNKFISAFGLGTCGDINHIDVSRDEPIYATTNPEKFGSSLGQTVIDELPKLKLVQKPELAMLTAKISLPLLVPSEAQIDSAKTIINSLYAAGQSGEYVKRAGGEAGDFIKRVEMSKYISLSARKPFVEVEVSVFRIDAETAIVSLPGEIFAELGLSIKKNSPFKNTIVLTVCNDKTSYIPTRKAFTEGSYEVTNAIIKPGAGEMLVETAGKLLEEIKK